MSSPFCEWNGGADMCVPCAGNKIKSTDGNPESLCDVDCGGVSQVANNEHTTCGKYHTNFLTPRFLPVWSEKHITVSQFSTTENKLNFQTFSCDTTEYCRQNH